MNRVSTGPAVVLVGIGVAALVVAPGVLTPGLLNAAIQMLIAALLATAYNVVCGQAGMLSFGHAAYFGVGAFATVHAMNAVGGTGLLPTPLLPLAGAGAGLLVGIGAGWFATKRSGTYFAMITLAIAELLHSLAPHLKGWFGGEAGVSAMRQPWMGLSFGSTVQVYYLTLAWVLVSLAALFFFTRTPLGRLALGLRENSHRLAFLGYDVHRLGVMVFAISAMFGGVAGGLQVVSNEAVNYVVFDATLSAAVVLNSYIGGVKVFLGPALGASLMTFFGYAVSDLTVSWLLYQGIVFLLVMLYVPDGLAGLFALWTRLRQRFGLAGVLPLTLAAALASVLVAGGIAFTVELLQRIFSQDYRALAAANPAATWPAVSLAGREWLPAAVSTWLVPASLLAGGALLAWAVRLAHGRLQNASAEPALAMTPHTARSLA
ncbi:branched-chain amino acid ABC transporter permease [Pseudorhodoferax sp. Leaf267]|uniref:branched-chain amino acid ABC transporter permease n=1 Tax=Pseudorhodoferax sp. Leaf267 TaxID=1736316 RepID=UPI0006F3634A|nr:branched-chain amino acid ABC transporter permease [Pseudorhodoferax sp. Leaf267]KQP17841.1 branched-chain amino acid ABC transporter permease [Pseudorhodoferax sp. Leaf267]